MLKAGATEVCITPPLGVELAGYGPRLHRRSTDIHDHLMAQALILDDGQDRVALITSDLIGVSPEFTQLVRQGVQKRTGIPANHVMVSCAHIHTAPTAGPIREWGAVDRSYVRMVARHLIGAVAAADSKRQPAHLSVGRGEHLGLAWNRVGRDEMDPTVEVVRVDAEGGDPLALLVHFACHPVMLGIKSAVSADYPGAMRAYLHRQYPGVVMFANGTCGDIDPDSNRVRWGSATFEDVARAGAALGDDAWEIASNTTPLGDVRIEVRQSTLRLPFDVPSLEVVNEQLAHFEAAAREKPRSTQDSDAAQRERHRLALARFWVRFYRELKGRILAGEQPDHEDAELQVFVMDGALAMLAIPAEVFTAQGWAIRAASPYAHTLPICYANGVYGYLPPRSDFEQEGGQAQLKGYASTLAAAVFGHPPYQPDVAERLVQAAAQLLTGA